MSEKQIQQHIALLRETFLDQAQERRYQDYWTDYGRLEAYDRTLARRILWKWQAVLTEAHANKVLPDDFVLVDWGCGSGVASEAWLRDETLPKPKEIVLFDRSDLAMSYTAAKIGRLPSATSVRKAKTDEPFPADAIVLLSHVINELPREVRENLLRKLSQVAGIIWVEPGTKDASLLLSEAQRSLRPHFASLHPCPHRDACPLGKEPAESNWCHFFAAPPTNIFHSAEWAAFARTHQIDLSTLPLSFLVASRYEKTAETPGSLILGSPHLQKGFADVILCTPEGDIKKERLLERKERSFIKRLSKSKDLLNYRALNENQ